MGSRWRDGLASQLQRLERGDVTIVALLVASTEQQVTDAAAACALFPQIEGLECRPVAPGVIRAAVTAGTAEETAARLRDLRRRLDAQTVASAMEWSASASSDGGGGGNETAATSPVGATAGGTLTNGAATSETAAVSATATRAAAAGVRAETLAVVSDEDVTRELLRRATPAAQMQLLAETSDEDLAREMLRRATSRGIGPQGRGTV